MPKRMYDLNSKKAEFCPISSRHGRRNISRHSSEHNETQPQTLCSQNISLSKPSLAKLSSSLAAESVALEIRPSSTQKVPAKFLKVKEDLQSDSLSLKKATAASIFSNARKTVGDQLAVQSALTVAECYQLNEGARSDPKKSLKTESSGQYEKVTQSSTSGESSILASSEERPVNEFNPTPCAQSSQTLEQAPRHLRPLSLQNCLEVQRSSHRDTVNNILA